MRAHRYHQVAATVWLTGYHEVTAEVVGEAVQVTIPGALITLADAHAARVMLQAWTEAKIVGRKVYSGQGAPSYRARPVNVTAVINMRGRRMRLTPPRVTGKAARYSPSGCGQVIVEINRLFTTVCDDRAAWLVQSQLWRDAYDLATGLWRMLPLDVYEQMVETRTVERLFLEGEQ